MSSDIDEWINKAIPAGSGRYYALLHSDSGLQKQQRLITTLVSVFSQLGFQSREIEVARHKLEWWRQELEKDSFDHPVMAAFANTTASANTLEARPATEDPVTANLLPETHKRLKILLEGYGALLDSGSPSNDEQNQQFHLATGAVTCQLICCTKSDEAVVGDAGVALSKLRCFRYLRQHVDHGLLCLPMSSLDAAGISPALLTPAAADDNVKRYLADALQQLQEEMQRSADALEAHVKEMPADKHGNYKALSVYLSLQIKLLQVMRKDDISVVEQVTRLTPIRNYWYAFRAARKFDKAR